MKQTINLSQFRDEFKAIRPDNFSYEGLNELFEYLEECEACDASEMELDVIAICCDFSQCSLREFCDAYGIACEDNDLINAVTEYMENKAFWFAFVEDGKEVVFHNI